MRRSTCRQARAHGSSRRRTPRWPAAGRAPFPTRPSDPAPSASAAGPALRDSSGRLIACAADTTEAPGVGFVAAITVRPELRGQGLGRRVTAWTLNRLVEREGLAALWHDGDNLAGAAVYDALGMRRLSLVWAERLSR